MEDERSIRLQAGCAILFIFDVIAMTVLAWFALGAGFFFPVDCFGDRQCDEARATQLGRIALIFWITVVANAGFAIWAFWHTRKR